MFKIAFHKFIYNELNVSSYFNFFLLPYDLQLRKTTVFPALFEDYLKLVKHNEKLIWTL